LLGVVDAQWASWAQALDARGDEGPDGDAECRALRAQVALSLRELQGALGLNSAPEGSGSLAAALQALSLMLEDPQAPLPGSLATALTLVHDRQADLHLRQLLAARDPSWAQGLLASAGEPAASNPADTPNSAPMPAETLTATPPGRDWWAIPIEGLTGSNQMFLLETRELLRGAEFSLQALAREPGDYAEQMVLCRSFQAVAVAATSMSLHRVAALAAQGERQFDRLLDAGGALGASVLAETELLLQRLYAELLDLVGEPVPEVVSPPAVQLPEGSQPLAAALHEDHEEVEPAEPQPTVVEAPQLPPSHVEPAPTLAPWWWAVDWSAWATDEAADTAVDVAEDASPDPESPDANLRLSTLEVRRWVELLWSQGHVAGARDRLVQVMEEATCAALETWSVALFRTARREARDHGLTVDFDIEGAQVRLDAASMQRLMPTLEHAIAARVAQCTGAALRLQASVHHGGVRLHLGDGHEAAWPVSVTDQMATLAAWLPSQGGTLRPAGTGWTIDLPTTPTQLPVCPVQLGSAWLWLPALWVLGGSALSSGERDTILSQGVLWHDGLEWPVADLGALIRTGRVGAELSHVVLMQRGGDRLALVVDTVQPIETVRPLRVPMTLAPLAARSGSWGLAQRTAAGVPCVVTDPFLLHQRFGAAARVLMRSRARRSIRP
jgi:hypothetical protein